jgi:hypothetical protein
MTWLNALLVEAVSQMPDAVATALCAVRDTRLRTMQKAPRDVAVTFVRRLLLGRT